MLKVLVRNMDSTRIINYFLDKTTDGTSMYVDLTGLKTLTPVWLSTTN